jgi:hypothetical protein
LKERAKKEKEGGRNGFDEHQDYKAKIKGTGSHKPQQIRKNDTKSPEQSCRT